MKLIAENKIDRHDVLKKLQNNSEKGILEEIGDSQSNDELLD
jgi:hypothetical protein